MCTITLLLLLLQSLVSSVLMIAVAAFVVFVRMAVADTCDNGQLDFTGNGEANRIAIPGLMVLH